MPHRTVEERLDALGIVLPQSPAPLGIYLPAMQVNNEVQTSGMLPMVDGVLAYTGPVGTIHDVTAARAAARLCALNAMAAIAQVLGGVDGLNRITHVLQVVGHVLCLADFEEQPEVINGASELLAEVLGEAGRHTRMALGASSLPRNATVELALRVQVRPPSQP